MNTIIKLTPNFKNKLIFGNFIQQQAEIMLDCMEKIINNLLEHYLPYFVQVEY